MMDEIRKVFAGVIGLISLIVVVTYCSVLVLCVWNWNEAGVAAFGTGFAVFAQSLVNKLVEHETGSDDEPKKAA